MSGWIKLYRAIRAWEWYKIGNTKDVFIDLLLTANIKDCKFRGQLIPRGSILTTCDDIAHALGLTKDEVRTALKHLKTSHTITTRKFLNKLLVTICNYDDFQSSDEHEFHTVPTQPPTQTPHGSHTVPTPTEEEYKEIKEYKNIRKESREDANASIRKKSTHGEYGWVKLTDVEYNRLLNDFGEDEVKRCISYVDESAQSTGNKNKWRDWNLVLRRAANGGWGKGQLDKQATERLAPTVSEVKRRKKLLGEMRPIVPDSAEVERKKKLLEKMNAGET